jgi:hypothetical protein
MPRRYVLANDDLGKEKNDDGEKANSVVDDEKDIVELVAFNLEEKGWPC